MNNITPAVAAVLGLAIGAVLQYYFSRRLEAARHYRELRTLAYSDFIGAVADSANASRRGDATLQANAVGKTAEAKVRILLYGSRKVVNALAAFSTAQGAVDSEPVARYFVALIQAMRADASIRQDHVSDNTITASVFTSSNKLVG